MKQKKGKAKAGNGNSKHCKTSGSKSENSNTEKKAANESNILKVHKESSDCKNETNNLTCEINKKFTNEKTKIIPSTTVSKVFIPDGITTSACSVGDTSNKVVNGDTVTVKKKKPNNKKNKKILETANIVEVSVTQIKEPSSQRTPDNVIKSEPEKTKNKKKKKKKAANINSATTNGVQEEKNATTELSAEVQKTNNLNSEQLQKKNKKKRKPKPKTNKDTNEKESIENPTKLQSSSIADLTSCISNENDTKFQRAIVFDGDVCIRSVVEFLKQHMDIENGTFYFRLLSRSLTMAESDNVKILDIIAKYLKKNQHGYFTYSPPEKRKLLVVLQMPKGEFALQDICRELLKLGIGFYNVSLFRSPWKPDQNYNLFLIHIPKDTDLQDLFEKDVVLGVTAKWSEFKKKYISQCRNCQRYGHVASNCNMPYRCVKCKDNHPVGKCKRKSKDNKPYCHNCQTIGHPSNYRGCPVHKKRLESVKRNKAKHEMNAALKVIAIASSIMQMQKEKI